MVVIVIENDGQAIASSNFWETENAKLGMFYLSWNANALRVLVPEKSSNAVKEMASSTAVVVSRGPWPQARLSEALEVLFEDGSDSPFALHVGATQTDRLPPATEQGRDFLVTIWTRDGEVLRFPGKYRVVKSLPCLEPWKGH